MKIYEMLLNETMTFHASKLEFNDQYPDGIYSWINDNEINLSNANMYMVIDALGLGQYLDNGHFSIPIDQFIGIATNWLQKHIGKPSEEIPTSIEQEPGKAKMIDLGTPEGYLNEKIRTMVQIAQEGKKLGATHVSAA